MQRSVQQSPALVQSEPNGSQQVDTAKGVPQTNPGQQALLEQPLWTVPQTPPVLPVPLVVVAAEDPVPVLADAVRPEVTPPLVRPVEPPGPLVGPAPPELAAELPPPELPLLERPPGPVALLFEKPVAAVAVAKPQLCPQRPPSLPAQHCGCGAGQSESTLQGKRSVAGA